MMKKLLCFFLMVTVIAGVTGCSFDTPFASGKNNNLNLEVDCFNDYYYESAYNEMMAHVESESVRLSSEDALKYPALDKVLRNIADEKAESTSEEFGNLKEIALEQYKYSGENFTRLESTDKITVKRADSKVLSYFETYYSYTGGAHGYVGEIGYNFDVATGEKLLFSDIVTDESKVFKIISESIDEDLLFPDTDVVSVLEETEEVNYTLSETGITVCFNPYEIGPYSSGIIKVSMSFSDYPDIINENYLSKSKSFVSGLGNGDSVFYDVNGDGTNDNISYYGFEEMYEGNSLRIKVGDLIHEEKLWFTDICGYFIHTEKGKNYLLIEMSMENDYSEIAVYELGNEIISKGITEGGSVRRYNSERGGYSKEIITNPESFNLSHRFDYLGTNMGYAEHRIGEEGLPEAKEKLVFVTWESDFTLKRELDVEIYDEGKDKVKGKRTLAEGEGVSYYAIDHEGYAYIKAENGEIFRVYVDTSSWPRTIDGVSVDDIFDGLHYAG